MNVHINPKITPIRIVAGLALYTIGVYLLWPPTIPKVVTISIFCAILTGFYNQVYIDR